MATASGDLAHTQQNCGGCNKPSFVDGTTVACNQCRRWYHSACAGGTGEIADGSWSCVACILSSSGPAKSVISTSSTRSTRVRLELLRLEELQKTKEKHMIERQERERLREERVQKEKEELAQKYIDEKYALLLSETLEDGASSVRSRNSRQKSLDKVNDWIEARHQENSCAETMLGDSILSFRLPLAAENQNRLHHGTPLSSLGAKVVTISESTPNRNLMEPIAEHSLPTSTTTQPLPPPPALVTTVSVTPEQPNKKLHAPTSDSQLLQSSTSVGLPTPLVQSRQVTSAMFTPGVAMSSTPATFSIVPPRPVATWMGPPMPESSSALPSVPVHGPMTGQPHLHRSHETQTSRLPPWQSYQSLPSHSRLPMLNESVLGQYQQQMAARQVVPRELPVFTGNPEDWPIFISSYCNSTLMCGYTDAENLMRLQKCLRGNAMDAVRSNLLLPSSVPQVMDTLETLFGNPERLIQSLLN